MPAGKVTNIEDDNAWMTEMQEAGHLEKEPADLVPDPPRRAWGLRSRCLGHWNPRFVAVVVGGMNFQIQGCTIRTVALGRGKGDGRDYSDHPQR